MWNYRVIQHTDNTANSIYYQIHEVYYDSDENPTSMTVTGVSPFGESTEELSHGMIHMMGALTKPVLDVKIFDTIERTEDTKLAVEQISKIGHKDV